MINQRLADFSYDYRGRQVPSPRAVPHRTALHGAAMKGFTPFVAVLGGARRGPLREGRERPHGARAREGHYEENFLKVAAEPHVDTVELLKKLMAETPQTLSSNVSAAGHGGSK